MFNALSSAGGHCRSCSPFFFLNPNLHNPIPCCPPKVFKIAILFQEEPNHRHTVFSILYSRDRLESTVDSSEATVLLTYQCSITSQFNMTLSQQRQGEQQQEEQQYQQQHRRRRPRSKQSSHTIHEKSSSISSPSGILLASLILLLTFVDRAAARQFLTPVAVGLRSALASRAQTSPWQPSSGANTRTRTSSYDRQLSARLVSVNDDYKDDVDDEFDSEEEFLEHSFFRASSEQDIRRIRTVRYAFSPKRVSTSSASSCSSELDHLEDLAIPCKAVTVRTAAAGGSPTTTSNDDADALSSSVSSSSTTTDSRGGASDGLRKLEFWESMVCGAVSRSVAQTIMHPANTMKTIMQNSRGGLTDPTYASLLRPESFRRLSQGAGANFLLSVPHGAINFAVLEFVRYKLAQTVEATPYLKERSEQFGAGLDFLSSAISTITCSIVSTPQMMITGMLSCLDDGLCVRVG
jgi:hypothetical protein